MATGVFAALWRAERDRHKETRRRLAATEAALEATREVLAVTRIDLAAHRRHWALAVAQRDGARALVVAITSQPEWTDADEAFLATGEWPR